MPWKDGDPDDTLKRAKSVPSAELCQDVHPDLRQSLIRYFDIVRNMEVDERPDYALLKATLAATLSKAEPSAGAVRGSASNKKGPAAKKGQAAKTSKAVAVTHKVFKSATIRPSPVRRSKRLASLDLSTANVILGSQLS